MEDDFNDDELYEEIMRHEEERQKANEERMRSEFRDELKKLQKSFQEEFKQMRKDYEEQVNQVKQEMSEKLVKLKTEIMQGQVQFFTEIEGKLCTFKDDMDERVRRTILAMLKGATNAIEENIDVVTLENVHYPETSSENKRKRTEDDVNLQGDDENAKEQQFQEMDRMLAAKYPRLDIREEGHNSDQEEGTEDTNPVIKAKSPPLKKKYPLLVKKVVQSTVTNRFMGGNEYFESMMDSLQDDCEYNLLREEIGDANAEDKLKILYKNLCSKGRKNVIKQKMPNKEKN